MNPKAEVFFDAVTLLPEELVEEAQAYAFRKNRNAWKKVGSLAACMALVVSLGLLAALPRGCGGSAPAGNGAPPASCDMAPEDGAELEGCTPQEPDAPQTPEAGASGGAETFCFTARVVEVLDAGNRASVLVEPLEGEAERNSADRIVVTVDGGMPELSEGDLVRITYDGTIQESYPAGITGAVSVEKLEESE